MYWGASNELCEREIAARGMQGFIFLKFISLLASANIPDDFLCFLKDEKFTSKGGSCGPCRAFSFELHFGP
jgi:hypothetical protein